MMVNIVAILIFSCLGCTLTGVWLGLSIAQWIQANRRSKEVPRE